MKKIILLLFLVVTFSAFADGLGYITDIGNGNSFLFSESASIVTSSTKCIAIATSSTSVKGGLIKLNLKVVPTDTSKALTIKIYEGTTSGAISYTDGSTGTLYNMKRNSTKTALTTLKYDATYVSGGTKIYESNACLCCESLENLILYPGYWYLIDITGSASTTAGIELNIIENGTWW